MKRVTTADRLRSIMSEQNLRQVDILERCKPFCDKMGIKLNKNDLSQYVSGKVVPGQDKLTVLAKGLNVCEVWLMGYDVPRDNTSSVMDYDDKYENDVIKDISSKLLLIPSDNPVIGAINTIIDREIENQQLIDEQDSRIKSLLNKRTIIPLNVDVVSEPTNITYIGKLASAGHPIDSFSDLMQGLIQVRDTPESRRADFAIGVLGESMEPTFYDGDIVLVKKCDSIRAGEIGIFQKDNEIYIKEWGTDQLISHNPKYKPIKEDTDILLIGKVIGKAEVIED